MSYVIQNFNNVSKLIVVTPRLRFAVLLICTPYLKFLLNINFYLRNAASLWQVELSPLLLFYKYLYYLHPAKLIRNANLKFVGNYVNNYIKSVLYYILSSINTNLSVVELNKHTTCKVSTTLLFNTSWLSKKTANYQINHKFYLNIFFMFMLIWAQPWLTVSRKTNFYQNFLLITYNLQIFNFYNGRFFRIYNF